MIARRETRAAFAALVSAAALSALNGCSTVMFLRDPGSRTHVDPTYESSRPNFFWGLVGDEVHVHVDRICLGKDVDQIAMTYTAGNVLASVITLGIYIPRTVQVWCEL